MRNLKTKPKKVKLGNQTKDTQLARDPLGKKTKMKTKALTKSVDDLLRTPTTKWTHERIWNVWSIINHL